MGSLFSKPKVPEAPAVPDPIPPATPAQVPTKMTGQRTPQNRMRAAAGGGAASATTPGALTETRTAKVTLLGG